jgi:hypothetical protein
MAEYADEAAEDRENKNDYAYNNYFIYIVVHKVKIEQFDFVIDFFEDHFPIVVHLDVDCNEDQDQNHRFDA